MIDTQEVVLDAPKAEGKKNQKTEIPFTLREYGEIPKRFIPVYIKVKKESLGFVGENGFRVEDNRMDEKNGKIEEIFDQAAQDMGIKVKRTESVFAYPRRPDQIQNGLGFDPEEDVLLEAMIDPKSKAIVADGEYYTEACVRYQDHRDEASARSWAKGYWEESKPLKQYLEEGHHGGEDDWNDFNFPEVLIPDDIPTSRIRVARTQPSSY